MSLKSILLSSILAVLPAVSLANGFTNVADMDLRGAQSCLVFHAETSKDNFGILCDGKTLWLTGAPSRAVFGKKNFKAFTDAYKKVMTQKCLEAGLVNFQTIDNATFFGLFCNR